MRLSRIRLLADQRGFAMPVAIGVMFVVMLASAATIAAARGDITLSRADQDQKQAQAAAEAGLNDYLARLNRDSNYWASCANVATPVTQPIKNRSGAAINGARKWRDVPDSNSEYSIELIPKTFSSSDNPKCDPADPVGSMVDGDGNLRIRVTGHVKGTTRYRSLIGTFRRKGFLDYLYLTDLENQDPAYIKRSAFYPYATYAFDASGNYLPNADNLNTWAGKTCERYLSGSTSDPAGNRGRGQAPYWRGKWYDPATNKLYPENSLLTINTNGYYSTNNTAPATRNDAYSLCGEIQFVTGDKVNGPFHSNDEIFTCGTPVFGRSSPRQDTVEISGSQLRKQANDLCASTAPTFYDRDTAGTSKPKLNAPTLGLPPNNGALADVAAPGYRFSGRTFIQLKGDVMDIAPNGGATITNRPLPPNGVIHVDSGACEGYDPTNANGAALTCGDVYVAGNYSKDLTISADNDVIVTGNLKRTTGNTTSLLGLIPQGFARIYHPSCSTDSPTNVQIDAAILALKSFTVDNYWCGGPLGTLTVKGAIAQKHRGVVGTGTGTTGYIKNYDYDAALKYRSPPYFLDPVQASWRLLRQSEQSPATTP